MCVDRNVLSENGCNGVEDGREIDDDDDDLKEFF